MQRLRSRSVEVVPMDPPRHEELSATIRLFCEGFGLDLSSLITTFSPTASRIGQMLSGASGLEAQPQGSYAGCGCTSKHAQA